MQEEEPYDWEDFTAQQVAFSSPWKSLTRGINATRTRTTKDLLQCLPLPKGLEPLGKRRKESAEQRPERAERAGASESLGRGEGERRAQNRSTDI